MTTVAVPPAKNLSNASEALQKLNNRSELILGTNVMFPARVSPNLSNIVFLPYKVTPGNPNWCGVTVIPVFQERPTSGLLGVEVVSPDRLIVAQGSTPLSLVEPYQPVSFTFPPIGESNEGVYELRVFVRNAGTPVSVLERRLLPPVYRLRRWRARPLCKLTFFDTQNDALNDDINPIASSRWKQPLNLDLASSVGSSSLEDHYWCSGWQTANVQLITNLQPNDTILDVGCGVGRMAHGFHGWYGGRYVGVDIMPKAIEYCKTVYPRFEFYHMDVKSPYYNPNGAFAPSAMVLPVENESVDVAVLFSVYTHLLPETFSRMTSELGRVIKPGGRCLASFLILDGQTDQAIFSFSHPWSEFCRVEDKEAPEGAVGYTKEFITNAFAKNGLRLQTYYQGTWSGQPGLTVQDQILFVKD